MGQSQNDHAIDKVRPEALSEQVVVVEVAMSDKTYHPELRAVYSDDCIFPT